MFAGKILGVIGASVLLTTCATTTAPRGWLSIASESQTTAYGGWVSVQVVDGRERSSLDGELVGVAADSIYILNAIDRFTAIAKTDISAAKITVYNSKSNDLTAWVILGTLSTASHGLVLILSAPVWVLTGSVAAISQSHVAQLRVPPKAWDEVRQYARFPQGIPPGLNRQSLQPKIY